MKKSKWQNAYLWGLVIIITVGLLIFCYNLYQGENLLTKDPNFDFSEYLNTKDFNPFFNTKIQELADLVNAEVKSQTAAQAAAESEVDPGVYFTGFFQKESPSATYNYIRDFWKDIDQSREVKIDDLYATDCFKFNVPAENRPKTLAELEENLDLIEFKVVKAPVWRACYRQFFYPEQIAAQLASSDAELIFQQPPSDYIARMDNDLSAEELKKIEETYSDVIKIKD